MKHFLGIARTDGSVQPNVSRHIVAESYGDAWDAWFIHCDWERFLTPVAVIEHPTGVPE